MEDFLIYIETVGKVHTGGKVATTELPASFRTGYESMTPEAVLKKEIARHQQNGNIAQLAMSALKNKRSGKEPELDPAAFQAALTALLYGKHRKPKPGVADIIGAVQSLISSGKTGASLKAKEVFTASKSDPNAPEGPIGRFVKEFQPRSGGGGIAHALGVREGFEFGEKAAELVNALANTIDLLDAFENGTLKELKQKSPWLQDMLWDRGAVEEAAKYADDDVEDDDMGYEDPGYEDDEVGGGGRWEPAPEPKPLRSIADELKLEKEDEREELQYRKINRLMHAAAKLSHEAAARTRARANDKDLRTVYRRMWAKYGDIFEDAANTLEDAAVGEIKWPSPSTPLTSTVALRKYAQQLKTEAPAAATRMSEYKKLVPKAKQDPDAELARQVKIMTRDVMLAAMSDNDNQSQGRRRGATAVDAEQLQKLAPAIIRQRRFSFPRLFALTQEVTGTQIPEDELMGMISAELKNMGRLLS